MLKFSSLNILINDRLPIYKFIVHGQQEQKQNKYLEFDLKINKTLFFIHKSELWILFSYLIFLLLNFNTI